MAAPASGGGAAGGATFTARTLVSLLNSNKAQSNTVRFELLRAQGRIQAHKAVEKDLVNQTTPESALNEAVESDPQIKLDLARMTGAEDVLAKYNSSKSGGVPWFAFLDARGNALVTSDGPGGNIGYPFKPEEIEHFTAMLRKVARRIEPAQVSAIEAALKDEARKIEAARPPASAK